MLQHHALPPYIQLASQDWRPRRAQPWESLSITYQQKGCLGHPTLGIYIVQEIIVIRIGCMQQYSETIHASAPCPVALRPSLRTPEGGGEQAIQVTITPNIHIYTIPIYYMHIYIYLTIL